MKTKNFFSNSVKTAYAIVAATVMTMGMTACSADDELDQAEPMTSTTRGAGEQPVEYVERYWDGTKVESNVKLVTDYIELKGSDKEGTYDLKPGCWYVVKKSFERKRICAPAGTAANLIVCDGATISGTFNIEVGQALNIYSQEKDAGIVDAKAEEFPYQRKMYNFPPIGSCGGMGTLVIHGGTIKANGTKACVAGIGGGRGGSGGKVTIYGGNITAKGGQYGTGIGSGHGANEMVSLLDRRIKNDGGTLTIYGGNVKATGGEYAAGIGGGYSANGGKVTIYGGKVSATGGTDSAGIGCGEENTTAPNINGGSLTVYGGDVFADGTGWGAGIGGGEDADGAKVEIYGGKVTAWAGEDAGKKNGSAIGSEDGDGHRGSLKLGDNMKVWAGQNPTDADRNPFPFATRVPACYFRPFARIVASK